MQRKEEEKRKKEYVPYYTNDDSGIMDAIADIIADGFGDLGSCDSAYDLGDCS